MMVAYAIVETLVVLSLLAVPMIAGWTTSRFSLIAIYFAVIFLLYAKRIKIYNKKVIFLVFLYFLMIATLTAEILVDVKLFYQFATSTVLVLFVAILSGYISERKDSRNYIILFVLVAFLLLVNVAEMTFTPLFDGTRLDVLLWQKESNYYWGINKFLLAIFVLCSLFTCTNNKNFVLKLLVVFLYSFYAMKLGSKTHFVLSSFFVFYVLYVDYFRINRNPIFSFVPFLFLSLFVVFGVSEYFEENLAHRFYAVYESFWETPRGRIINEASMCYSSVSNVFFGNDIANCLRETVDDVDNSFLYALSSGGLLSLTLLVSIVAANVYLLMRMELTIVLRLYLVFSYIVLLNIDVLVARGFLFFPFILFLFQYKKDDKVIEKTTRCVA